jgi:hypothetical protein
MVEGDVYKGGRIAAESHRQNVLPGPAHSTPHAAALEQPEPWNLGKLRFALVPPAVHWKRSNESNSLCHFKIQYPG